MKLKQIVKETLQKLEDLNPLMYQETKTGTYAVAGNPKIQKDLTNYTNHTMIERSSSKAYNGLGECVFPFQLKDDIIVYVNIVVNTKSPRTEPFRFSLLNKLGLTVVGLSVLKKIDGLWHVAQVNFRYIASQELYDFFSDFSVLDAEDIVSDVKRNLSNWFLDSFYVFEGEEHCVKSLDDEAWIYLNNSSRLGVILSNRFLAGTDWYKLSGRSFVTVGRRASDSSSFTYELSLRFLWAFEEENKAAKRAKQTSAPKKGTVQYRINEYCELVDESFTPPYTEGRGIMFVQALPGPKDIACMRIYTRNYREGTVSENFRVFIEKKQLTFAERVDSVWTTTKTTIDSYTFSSCKLGEIDYSKLKGTKLEYLEKTISKLSKHFTIDAKTMLMILTCNLYEIMMLDEDLSEHFLKFVEKNDFKGIYVTVSLEYAVSRFFDSFLNEEFSSKKRIKNLPKKKWFKLNKYQLKRLLEEQNNISQWVDVTSDEYQRFGRYHGGSVFTLVNELLGRQHYYYSYRPEVSDFSIEKLSSVENNTFDKFLNLVKRYYKIRNPFDHHFKEIFREAATISEKEGVINMFDLLDGNPRLYCDAVQLARQANYSLPRDRQIPMFRRDFRTAQEIRDWHDDLVELTNQLNSERNRYFAKKEAERCKILQENYDKRQKEFKNFAFEDENFEIKWPEKPSDLSQEGMSLHHCVKGYVDRVAQGYTTILFIRKKENIDKPFFTMEVSGEEIRQIHGFGNCNVKDVPEKTELENFVNAFAKTKNLTKGQYNQVR